ncbi:MAG: hypothetical protein JWL81_1691 [Verrucomicrobiales bacterium]|nr:hypothetical protein [Verrucomicrobiales bacterium]
MTQKLFNNRPQADSTVIDRLNHANGVKEFSLGLP